MADYTLYCMAQSGNAYKVALMLTACGADWEAHWVDFFNGETRTEEYRRDVNVMGEVPVLVQGDLKLTQSGSILYHLVGEHGQYGPKTDDEEREVLRWILFDNHKFTSYTGTYRFLRQFMKSGDTPVTEFLGGRMHGALAVLDQHMAGREYVAADRPTIADISMCGYMFFDDEIGLDWDQYPNIHAWLGRIRELPGWTHPYEMMPGHPLPD
jgi:glutathione S-transferase